MRDSSPRSKGVVFMAVVLLIFALGTIAFWTEFFSSGMVAMSNRPAYLEHEKSFPAADAYMVVCSVIGAVGLLRRRTWGLLFGLMAGSAIIFLGLMDTLYSLQQGIFNFSTAAGVEAIFITAVCLILGPFTIAYLWLKRADLS